MKNVKIGINGFGRIGRLVLRASQDMEGVDVVAINDPFLSIDYAEYLYKYDSAHGVASGDISHNDKALIINNNKVLFSDEKTPESIQWAEMGVDIVIDCTGVFKTADTASLHLKGGAKKVIISCPSSDTPTFVMGVNSDKLESNMTVVNNASCTTNCLAPLVKIIDDAFGVEEGLMSTIHATTATQLTVDGISRKDWRGGRAASANIIPSSTGAAKAVGLVLPHLNGKLTGMSFRVPTINVSVVDLTVKLKNSATIEEINKAIKTASETNMAGVVEYVTAPIVSSDVQGNSHTCVYDSLAGVAISDKFVKLVAWYDNEWGYSNKLLELAKKM